MAHYQHMPPPCQVRSRCLGYETHYVYNAISLKKEVPACSQSVSTLTNWPTTFSGRWTRRICQSGQQLTIPKSALQRFHEFYKKGKNVHDQMWTRLQNSSAGSIFRLKRLSKPKLIKNRKRRQRKTRLRKSKFTCGPTRIFHPKRRKQSL